LHDQRNAAIRRIEGIIWQTQALIRVAAHLENLIAAKPLVFDQTARGIGAVCGKLLVPMALVIGIGQRICMPFDGDAVGHAAELLCQYGQQFTAVRVHDRVPGVEKPSVLRFEQLDRSIRLSG